MVASALRFLRSLSPQALALAAATVVLAGGSGFLAATALGLGSQNPSKTVTINVATGPTGPVGPPGPPGPKGDPGAGGLTCPDGYEAGKLVINHPGGQTAIWTCLG